MLTVPVHDYGFMVTPELAPYFMLAAERMAGNPIPDAIQDMLLDGTFDQKAAELDRVLEDEDYLNPMVVKEALDVADMHSSMAYVSDFCGDVDTIEVPDPDTPGQTKPVENPIEMNCDGDIVVYQPLTYGPSLFHTQYADPEAIVAEVKAFLDRIQVRLPAGFDDSEILRHVVRIYGTTSV